MSHQTAKAINHRPDAPSDASANTKTALNPRRYWLAAHYTV